jgi:hypothetical protein
MKIMKALVPGGLRPTTMSCGIHFSFFEDMGEFMREAGRDVKTFFAGPRDWLVGVMLAAVGLGILGLTQAAPAQLTPGDILVIDQSAGTDLRGALLRMDPKTGTRTVLSDFGDSAQGPLGGDPVGVAVETSGTILVTDHFVGTNLGGVLFRVDPQTGMRTVLSDFGDAGQGPRGEVPLGVAVEVAGTILVSNSVAGTNSRGALFRVDPQTGTRTLLSDLGDAGQGSSGANPLGVAVEVAGTILVSNSAVGMNFRGVLFRVDPQTGTRTLLSDLGDAGQGPVGGAVPAGVAVVPAVNIVDLSIIKVDNPDPEPVGGELT